METKKRKASDLPSVVTKKIAALAKGALTDCTFLVGPDDASAQEVYAFKSDLLVASEYFAGLLMKRPSTLNAPIRLKHLEPQIFRLVIEYVHTSGQSLSEVGDLDQCLKLSEAADEFLIDDLGQMCTEMLQDFVKLDNVWSVFSQNHMIKYSSAACKKILSTRTEECLEQPAFLEIDEKTLIAFLQIEKMSIKSEMVLVAACIKFAKQKENSRNVFRRCALAHLRLLTLKANDLAEVDEYLNQNEKLFLSLNLLQSDPLQVKNVISCSSLCKEPSKRHLDGGQVFSVDLLPDKSLLDLGAGYQDCQFVKLKKPRNKFYLFFVAESAIRITGFEILCNLQCNFFDSNFLGRLQSNEVFKSVDGLSVDVRIRHDELEISEYSSSLKPKKVGTCASFETSIFVMKGCSVTLEVLLEGSCFIRKVPMKLVQQFCTDQQGHPLKFSWNYQQPYSIFKSIQYQKV